MFNGYLLYIDVFFFFFFFKQKTAYEMRISDWSSDVCSSDLQHDRRQHDEGGAEERAEDRPEPADDHHEQDLEGAVDVEGQRLPRAEAQEPPHGAGDADHEGADGEGAQLRNQRPDADDLGGDVHVADRHPRPAGLAADPGDGAPRNGPPPAADQDEERQRPP